MAPKKFEPKEIFETSISDAENIPEQSYLIKPCEWYKEEYKDCKSIRARFQHYFVYGETLECGQWKNDYENCMDFRKKKNTQSLEKVIESEMQRKKERHDAAVANDIWRYRDGPPENWNSPLPEWQLKLKRGSHLEMLQELRSQGKDLPVPSSSKCIIS